MKTKTKTWLDSVMRDLWASGKVFVINGNKYTMHKMSYGDYFAEPRGWRGGENDGFAKGTLWFKKFIENHKVYYKLNNLLNN